MEANGSHCPEGGNSTDCLLRTLLQLLNEQKRSKDDEIDWDPVSFAFTLLIGLVASAFAFVTVLQAIFTAGRGRRKANENAIGRWSAETVTKWRFSSMESQTIAWTPILKYKGVWKALTEQGDADLETKTQESNKRNYTFRGILRHIYNEALAFLADPEDSPNASASWIGFLREVGLEQINLPIESRRKIATDYLPDDLVAAPAFAEVGIIFTAAACAGALWTADKESKYPTIVGPDFQFDLRTHPVLGTVGAYSRYGKDRRSDIPTKERLLMALKNSRGELDTTRGLFTGYRENNTLRGYIGLIGGFHSMGIVDGWFEYFWQQCNNSEGIAVSPDLMKNDFLPLIRLFQASTPDHAPALLPVSRLKMNHPLTLLALNGFYWSQVPLTVFDQWDKFHQQSEPYRPKWAPYRMMIGPVVHSCEEPEFFDYLSDTGIEEGDSTVPIARTPWDKFLSWANQWDHMLPIFPKSNTSAKSGDTSNEETTTEQPNSINESEESSSKMLELHQRTIFLCLLLLEKPEELEGWFSSHPPQDRNEMRSMVLKQLKDIDRWLDDQPNKEHRASVLFNTTLSLCRAQEMHGRGHFEDLLASEKSAPNLEFKSFKNAAGKHHESMLQALLSLSAFYQAGSETEPDESHEDALADDGIDKRIDELSEFLTGTDFPEKEDADVLVNKRRIICRLGVIARRNFTSRPKPSSSTGLGREEKILDDIIIYRCLLMALLLWTAPDCSGLLLSGLWEQIIPII